MKERTVCIAKILKKVRAGLLIFFAGVLFIVSFAVIIFYRNPWYTHKLQANQLTEDQLEELSGGTSPYVRIDGLDLFYTGFYKKGTDGEVYAYCYKAELNGINLIVELPTEDGGELAGNSGAESMILSDYSVVGMLDHNGEIVSEFAKTEDMTSEEYREYYQYSEYELHVYDSDREQWKIYQLMLIIAAIGMAAIGIILWSESRMIQEETNDEEPDENVEST